MTSTRAPGTDASEECAQPRSIVLRLGYAVLGLAIALRLIEYLHNKAIWLDEAHLVLSIVQRGYAGLLKPLEFNQGAPLLFLWVERLAVDALGPGELSLRLLPLLASLVSCVLLFVFLRRSLPGSALLVTLLIFALATPVIRYAAEIKQYASDLAVVLALLLLLFRVERRPLTLPYALVLTLAGCISVWFAFPALFVLAGIGAVYFVHSLATKRRNRAALFAVVGAAWLASIAVNYWVMLRHNAEDPVVRAWWLADFMPLPPRSLTDVNWFIRRLYDAFGDPLGLGAASGIGTLLFALGVYALWRGNRLRLALLLAPIAAGLMASGMEKYPFTGRFLLFTVPLLLVVIGEGWHLLGVRTQQRAIMAIVAAVLLVPTVVSATKGALRPGAEGVLPAFAYLRGHWQEGDTLYVYRWALPMFRYYELKTGTDFPKIEGLSLRADWAGYVTDLAPLNGSKRAWVVLTNVPNELARQDDMFILTHLDSIGARTEQSVYQESGVYRYDLSGVSP